MSDLHIARNVLARFLGKVATEFPTEKALKNYLHDHPGADPKNHSVAKSEASPTQHSSQAKKRFESNKQTLSDMKALQNKVEKADTTATKKFDKAYTKLFDAGEAAAKDAKKLIEKHPEDTQLLQQYLSEWTRNKADHLKAEDELSQGTLQQAKITYGYAQQLDSIVKDFDKLLADPDNAEIDDSWRK